MTPHKKVSSSTKFQKIALPLALLLVLLAGGLWIDGDGLRQAGLSGRGYDCPVRLTAESVGAYRGIPAEMVFQLGQYRSLDIYDVCVIPQDKLELAISKVENPKPGDPDKALEWRMLTLQDENGIIPADGYARAAEHMRGMNSPELSDVAGISSGGWTWIGPGNIGGRVRSILIDPGNPDNMWTGSVSGGIWKTTDGGANWSPVNDFMASLAIGSMAMDKDTPTTMYAGTGEGFFIKQIYPGAGIFRTTDGGATWTQIPTTANENFLWVNRMALHPANPSVMLAATRNGLWRSTNVNEASIADVKWTKELEVSIIKDVDFDPNDGNNAVASGSNGKAYYSKDGGDSWNPAAGLPRGLGWVNRAEVAYAPSNSEIVYLSLFITNPTGTKFYKSIDGGKTYSLVTDQNILTGQGWYNNVVWVDPTDADTLIVGGIDINLSTDGGLTFTNIRHGKNPPISAHPDQHIIIEHPNYDGVTNKTIFIGNDGGVYKAADLSTVGVTTGWTELNNNLGITQFYGAAGNPITGNITGGTQDNGTLYYSGDAEGWTSIGGGDGGFTAVDWVTEGGPWYYGESQNLRLQRWVEGENFSYIHTGLTDTGRCANFIAPFVLDPNTPTTMLAGGCNLWRSTNVTATPPENVSWTIIKDFDNTNFNVSAIAVASGNANYIWVGHNYGALYRTINGLSPTPIWEPRDKTIPNLPNRYVTRIAIDPTNNDHVYVTFGGFSDGNVWKTEDGGVHWEDRSGSGETGLPEVPVRSLVIHPYHSNWIYVGTEVGVFASEDGGLTWSRPQDGPANLSVDELFWMNTTLVAATYGRGLFTTETLDPTTTVIKPNTPDTSLVGQPLIVEFEVIGNGPLTGKVTVNDTASPANCEADVAVGQCEITLPSAGERTLIATYWGDPTFGGSSDSKPHTVRKHYTTTKIHSHNPEYSLPGDRVRVVFTVTANDLEYPLPTGRVWVSDSLSTAVCWGYVSDGYCDINMTNLGPRTLTALYEGDPYFFTSLDQVNHVQDKAVTSIQITSVSPNTAVVGEYVNVSFTVNVTSPVSGTPNGTITVTDSQSQAVCIVFITTANDVCRIIMLNAGPRTLTATFSGNTYFYGSSDTIAHMVNKADTTTTVSVTPYSSVTGQKVTVTFTVTVNEPGSGAPTREVVVTNLLGTATCSASVGIGQCDITLDEIATHVLIAGYQGDDNFNESDDLVFHERSEASTTTTITSISPASSYVDKDVTVNFDVTVNPPGSGTVTGTVTVTDDQSQAECSAPVAAKKCVITLPSAGARTLTATYSRNTIFFGSEDSAPYFVNSGPSPGADTIGVHDPATGNFKLRHTNDAGPPDLDFHFAEEVSGGIPLMGDWDGDGVDTIGVYSPLLGEFHLRNSNDAGPAHVILSHQKLKGGQPIVGDWDGDRADTFGIYLDGFFYLRNQNTIGKPDLRFRFGEAGIIPLAGDWDGDGVDTIGAYSPHLGKFQLRNTNSAGPADITIQDNKFRNKTPLVGDWDGDGDDTLGIYMNGTVFLRNSNDFGEADLKFDYGGEGLLPVTGDGDGS